MDVQIGWDFIKAQLPTGWRELAVERGLIRPQPPQLHAKVTDIEQVLRPLLFRIGVETSLQTAVSTTAMAKKVIAAEGGDEAAEAAQVLNLSAPALHYWERKLPGYLSELVARMVGSAEIFSPARWHGYEVVVADGTTVTRPGADGTTARVLYALRLSDLSVVGCHATDEHGTESLRIFDVCPGQLWMGDRFYANPYDIAWVVDAGADALVRYKFNALPLYHAQGQRFDVMGQVRSLHESGQMAEWPVEVRPKGHKPIPGRLCAVRLPEEEAKKARDRLRREQGADVSPQSLEATAWLILFTTAATERMTTRETLDLYRLRWQVELEIRRDKSLGGLDKLPNFRPDTIATWLLGKLLIQQIARKAVSPSVAFPPSTVGVAVFFASSRNPREAASPQRARRRRDVARDESHLRGHSRRATPRAAARSAPIR
jgi:Transposase DDE domain